MLASTTLAAGMSGLLGANDFRYQSITPLQLIAGQTYTIAGFSPLTGSGNDAWVYGGPNEITGFAVDPAISIGADAARFDYNTGVLADPSTHFSDYQIYAVNFQLGAVPEPASWALMIAGIGLAGGALRLKRRPLTA
jgi:hypothetical protein